MSSKNSYLPPLTEYYRQEQAYLRDAGRRFAQEYPKLARRLDWNGDDTQDPHIERLLESFAFLTARIQRQTDDLFPETARALLNFLYPPLTHPLPPMSVAAFQLDFKADKWKDPFIIPSQTSLFAKAFEGQICSFRTVYPLALWPLEIQSLDYVPREHYPKLSSRFQTRMLLRLRLKSEIVPLSSCPLKHLRFYLGGTEHEAALLYQVLLSQKACVAWHAEGILQEVQQPDALRPAGFTPEECSLPYPAHIHHGYRLLHEFFYCPEKFLFCDLTTEGLQNFHQAVDVLISIPDTYDTSSLPSGPTQMQLWCTPIVNLFGRTTEPFRLTHHQNTSFLCPDQTRESITEIQSVVDVFRVVDQTAEPQRIPPFFTFNAPERQHQPTLFWHGQHCPSKQWQGTDYQIHFVDLDLNPHIPYGDVIFAKVLCTNRSLASHIPIGGLLDADIKTPTARIVCLKRPSKTLSPPQEGQILWALIRHLATHHLAPSEPQHILDHTRHLMDLYRRLSGNTSMMLENALVDIDLSTVVRPMRQEAWRGFVTGQKIKVTLDEKASPYVFLLGQVLAHFWSTQNDFHSFFECQLQRKNPPYEWTTWAPRVEVS